MNAPPLQQEEIEKQNLSLKMADTALYQRLEQYNNTIENNFKSNWGSLLTYLDGNDTGILTTKADSVQAKEVDRRRAAHARERDAYMANTQNNFIARMQGRGPSAVSVRNSVQRPKGDVVKDAFDVTRGRFGHLAGKPMTGGGRADLSERGGGVVSSHAPSTRGRTLQSRKPSNHLRELSDNPLYATSTKFGSHATHAQTPGTNANPGRGRRKWSTIRC